MAKVLIDNTGKVINVGNKILTGEAASVKPTWLLNETVNKPSTYTTTNGFTSLGPQVGQEGPYKIIKFSGTPARWTGLVYAWADGQQNSVYTSSTSSWVDQGYRTVTFLDSLSDLPSGLVTWLDTNGTRKF